MVVYGIPCQEGEEARDIIRRLASALHLPYTASDIAACHRLPSRGNNVPPIIVRFVDYESKGSWIKASKNMKITSDALGIMPPPPFSVMTTSPRGTRDY